jgi:hypothetical protein
MKSDEAVGLPKQLGDRQKKLDISENIVISPEAHTSSQEGNFQSGLLSQFSLKVEWL